MTSTTPSAHLSADPPAPTVLRARSPEDLLAVVPVVLGFEPADSAVMLTFAGRHQFHARVDLPAAAEHACDVADVLLDPAAHHGVPDVALLLYTDDARRAGALWSALRRGASRRRIHVVDALRVEQRRYFPLLGRDARVREIGVAYDVEAHPFLAQAVLEGRVTRRTREELAATLEARPGAVDAVAEHLARLPRPDVSTLPPDGLLGEGEWVEALVGRHLADGTRPDDADLARLLLAVQHGRLRDAAWSCLTRPGAPAAVELFTDLVQRTPPHLVPPVASLLAWAAWLAGDGALAWCALDRCTDVDPGYGLAGVIASGLTRAVPPAEVDVGIDWRVGLSS